MSNEDYTENLLSLADTHKRMLLEESRISAEVVAQRGYRTVEDAQELHELGFADYQVRPPGLLIPVRGTGSEVLFSRFRPDTPRLRKNGKPAKYEQPQGTGVILDVPPSVQDGLRDVERRLWIGEGEKKADSLASLGEVAISILGVWSWKRQNLLLPQWDDISTIGREIIIAFDSDAVEKYQVRLAEERLSHLVAIRGGEATIRRIS